MPVTMRTVRPGHETEVTLSDDQLPIELYLRIEFDDSDAALAWVESAMSIFSEMRYSGGPHSLDRVALWGPQKQDSGMRTGGNHSVFLSELAVRLLRASTRIAVPRTTLVSVSELDYGMKMYLGTPVDERVYKQVRHG